MEAATSAEWCVLCVTALEDVGCFLCTGQRIPYLGPIYGGLREGSSIYLQGSIPDNITRWLHKAWLCNVSNNSLLILKDIYQCLPVSEIIGLRFSLYCITSFQVGKCVTSTVTESSPHQTVCNQSDGWSRFLCIVGYQRKHLTLTAPLLSCVPPHFK